MFDKMNIMTYAETTRKHQHALSMA